MSSTVAINRGSKHDVRFLAIIDSLASPESLPHDERLTYWREWEITEPPEVANLWVARIGGLYAGYLALQGAEIHSLQVQPRLDVEGIGNLLIARAGLVRAPEMADQNLMIA